MKKIIYMATLCVCLTFLSGCIRTGDELLQAPKLPSDYTALQNQIDKEVQAGKIQVEPETGLNRNTVQLVDIDSDGEEEAIAFFRQSSVSGTFEVVLYERENGKYVEVGRIYGEGSSIDSVSYPSFSPTGGGGIAISWKIGEQLEKGITVAKYEQNELNTVLDTKYLSTFLLDVETDGIDEIFIVNRETDKTTLGMYKIDEEGMTLASKADLSKEIDTIARITTGELVSGGKSVAIDSRIVDSTGLMTDFVTYDGEKLVNLTMEENSSLEATYRATSSYSSKIFGDNVIYIPTVTETKNVNATENITANYTTTWHLYDLYNPIQSDIYTFHNNTDGWYFILTEDVKSNLIIERDTIDTTRVTSFKYYNESQKVVDLFDIYAIPKDDFNQTLLLDGYVSLAATTSTVFVARNINPTYASGFTNDEILLNFNLIVS